MKSPILISSSLKWRKLKDRIFFWTVCILSGMTAIPLVAIIWEVVKKGYKQINLNFFTETAPSTLDAMLAKSNGEIIPGGIANGITGTLLMVFIASAIAIPTGIMGGIHLAEKSKSLFFTYHPVSDRPATRYTFHRYWYHCIRMGGKTPE